MATASHEHIPDLSASLSKSHHRAPISDLWGPSLSQKRSSEVASDYAMEIAMDTSRGPLMSSASTAVNHDAPLDEPIAATEPAAVPVSAKVGSALWSTTPTPVTSVGGSAPGSATSNGSAAASAPGATAPPSGSAPPSGLQLRSLATSNPPPSYRGPHPATTTSAAAAAPPGTPSAVNPVTPIGHFRSGIWGPRQNFGAFNAPTAFQQPQSAGSVYAKTPWSVDLSGPSPSGSTNPPMSIPGGGMAIPNPNAQVPNVPAVSSPVNGVATAGSVPVQSGFYGMPGTVSGSVPAGPSPLQNMTTPPQTSPSPPAISGSSAARLYQTRSAQPTPTAVTVPTTSSPQQHQGSHPVRSHSHGSSEGLMNATHGRPPKKNGRPSTNTELYKTELCASYMSTGGNCPYGEKCQFAHGPEELKSVDRPPKWRSKPCQNWVKTGSCSYNERCCFRHDVPVGHTQQ